MTNTTPNNSHSVHSIETSSGKIAYRDLGQGTPVIFVHGTPSSSREFEAVMNDLKSHFRCIALDHLGFGDSDRPKEGDYSLEAHTQRLRQVLSTLKIDRFHLVVHDFGGGIALPIAVENPERILSLTLLNTWAWPMEKTDPEFAKNKKLMTSSLMRFFYLRMNFSARFMVRMAWGKHRPLTREKHRLYTHAFPNRQSRLGTWAFVHSLCDSDLPAWHLDLNRLAKVRKQIVWGMGDKFFSERTLQNWLSIWPDTPVHRLDQVGHFVADEAPELLSPLLKSFLGS